MDEDYAKANDLFRWARDGKEMGWKMPRAPRWKRLPVIRHVRAIWAQRKIDQHNQMWMACGMAPTGYDEWVVYGIWRGMEASDEWRS